MNGWLLAARLALAVVFGASGAAKLFDHAGTRESAAAFGVPSWLAGLSGFGLPAVELAVAAALVPASSAALAGWAAAGLLAVFSALVAVSLARGRRPACHCFGALTAAPVGWPTLARNALLAGIALFVAVGGWPRGGASLGGLGSGPPVTATVIGVLAVVVAAQTVLVVVLMGRYGEVLRRIDQLPGISHSGAAAGQHGGLPVGSTAPDFALPGAGGQQLTLSGLRSAGRPVLLLFGNPDCGPCQSLLPDLARWQAEHAGQFTAALISSGSMAANQVEAAQHHLTHVGVQHDQEVALSYRYAGTPSAVAVSSDGRIASPVVAGPDSVRSLAAVLLRRAGAAQPGVSSDMTPGSLRGQPAPPAKLADLDGRQVNLAAPRDHPAILLFWNPACGFCQQALTDVKAREQGPVDFVFVSAGTAQANRELGLSSPVLLDPGFATASAFGATGTPSAVLIGTDGRIASELAVGAPALLALADEAIKAATAANPA